jgi:hypothetical protein
MADDSASYPPRITLRHGTADATFAARLARDLLNMYGEETVRLVGPTDPGADEHDLAAAPDTSTFIVVALSPESLASGEIHSVLRSTAPMIAVTVRECDLPAELAVRRVISFAETWRYDLALAELLDAIRLGSVASTPAVSEGMA